MACYWPLTSPGMILQVVGALHSGQIILFHQPRFPWNKGDFSYWTTIWGEVVFSVAIICQPSFIRNSARNLHIFFVASWGTLTQDEQCCSQQSESYATWGSTKRPKMPQGRKSYTFLGDELQLRYVSTCKIAPQLLGDTKFLVDGFLHWCYVILVIFSLQSLGFLGCYDQKELSK